MKRIFITLIAITALLSIMTGKTYSDNLVERDTAQFNKMYTGKYLYTNPDPAAKGGLKGEIVGLEKMIVSDVFALPPHEPRFVYRAVQGGTENRIFEFYGLPPAKYDLFVAFEHEVYEGLTLNRYKNTLTETDRKAIEYIIKKSDPFFEQKIIHRVSGVTGKKKGKARAIVSEIRLGPVTDMANNVYAGAHKRNYKIFFLEDVGPGYQIARSRDISSKFVAPGKDIPKWNYRPYLSSIRVTDSMKDLGKIDLTIPGEERELPDPVDEIDPGASISVDTESTEKKK
ncbi:MAG: hypothetical protein PHR77_15405 [Kiritimatiellae bacterium]|nr:hypothetical protein [Kiritimatiellia bacterium]MDD5522637.1 hypothetical protein [Kiritimatiellia bacterium]